MSGLLRICLVLLSCLPLSTVQADLVPRTLIALYDSVNQRRPNETHLHKFAGMPLNHLGYVLEYHDVQQTLPNLTDRPDVAGILTWFMAETEVPRPREYLRWLTVALDSGKKLVILDSPGFSADEEVVTLREVNQLWNRLGVADRGKWITQTYLVQFPVFDRTVVDFERRYQGELTAFRQLQAISSQVTSHLVGRLGNDLSTQSSLVFTGPKGGYVAEGYDLYFPQSQEVDYRKWYINPFRFFSRAFDQNELPKPDTTTLAGRRIFYSHIDGDGWNNLTMIESYRQDPILCAEVISKSVLQKYDDLPFTVAPIAADMNSNWVGTERSRKVARQIFTLPNVEVGCHTYTHPFDWFFFADYKPQDEAPYLKLYPNGGWESPTLFSGVEQVWNKFKSHFGSKPFKYPVKNIGEGYIIPRAYALKPFDLKLEIEGAIREVQALAPEGKKVMVYQWSGNCWPFKEALAGVIAAGIRNLNGGNTRFDDEYSSYAWVAPIGWRIGDEVQIFASSNNENTYTDMWLGRYYGFNKLPLTYRNTETPWRVKPVNLYFHMFSGERLPGFKALLSNIEYIRSQSLIPIAMSHFAAIAEGFYSTEVHSMGPRQWKIAQRGALQTIRFDNAALATVDLSRSQGVVGQRHFQGSLYVYLDVSSEEPVIALKDSDTFWKEPSAVVPYLIDSRWPVWGLKREGQQVAFTTQGFGTGEMRWRVPADGRYVIEVEGRAAVEVDSKNGVLAIELERSQTSLKVGIRPLKAALLSYLRRQPLWSAAVPPPPLARTLTLKTACRMALGAICCW